ncbi:4-(cytidine 5'-diphospho)-2-C-methyl-D-erythritol kinase [Sulfurovum sp. ST-21]|uniref:4-diphosphocytidyl-2-C-methyl-D-erythritol kinase n=1 Tax=Sulfurovum indicum TaxID=2779528 RepID=A0A7M1S2H5_9BACT|nr:4-(cytidine 5'-diphospho)-2-C-methyl-D-erythritol kinase [Sulfurovum indicum]QOR61578.1 4-(cytidine 5'-diphospho)-2-C-methyl-D-erythritol kinase [Sulfurovum indicum]
MRITAHAKVNIFLKITGHKEGYHTLLSRFMRVDDLYDTLTLIPEKCETFTIEGCGDIPTDSNTIYKAFQILQEYTGSKKLKHFFENHKVVVEKHIPSQAGLGGGSSDAAAFIRLVNEVCSLDIPVETLAELGSRVGADLPFFIYNYPSANVSGFGELVEAFEEETLPLELFTPDIGCDTALVYKTFKQHLLNDITLCSFTGWEKYRSKDLLELIADPVMLNDLYAAALIAYPELKKRAPESWFFSGSGSTFFRIKT